MAKSKRGHDDDDDDDDPRADASEPVSSDDEDGTKQMLAELRSAEQRRRAQELADEELARRFASEEAPAAGGGGADQPLGSSLRCVACESNELRGGAVMLDACLHVFCRDCVAAHLVRVCAAWKGGAEPGCPHCAVPVAPPELRSLLSPEQYAQFSDRQARSALTDAMYIQCVNDKCNNVMERLPPADSEARRAKDPAERCRLEYRMRCRECDTIFCASCRKAPFHDSYTCEGFDKFSKSRHCRFCDAAIDPAKAKPVVAVAPPAAAAPPKRSNSRGRRAPARRADDGGGGGDDVLLANEDATTIADVCDDDVCIEAAKLVCRVRFACGP